MITTNFLNETSPYLKKNEVLILGNQVMDIPHNQGVRAVDWLHNNLGCTALDLDINGNADIRYDLSKYANTLDGSPFEVIADFGTMEHVDDPANCLRNLYAWLYIGGDQIHVSPNDRYQDEQHQGLPRFGKEFYTAYADLTGMVIVVCKDIAPYDSTGDICTLAILQKTSNSTAPKKKEINALIKKYAKAV